MTELLIIADDLTGAIEAGVLMAKQGISARVIHYAKIDLLPSIVDSTCTVLVVNTESRHIPQQQAAEKINVVIDKARLAGVSTFYKKTDSTLRGNIGAELEALIDATAQRSIAFIPAHPKLKRFTKNGFHYIEQQLLHETDFGKDPLEPIKNSNVSEILKEQTHVTISSVNQANQSAKHLKDGIWVFDCQSMEDMVSIGDFILEKNLHNAIAGSAAMVELLPNLLGLKRRKLRKQKSHGSVLIVNGSLNSISLKQVNYAHQHGIPTLSIPVELLSDDNSAESQFATLLTGQIKTVLEKGRVFILNSTDINEDKSSPGDTSGYKNPDIHTVVSKNIGMLLASILRKVQIDTLVVFGGDTTAGIMHAIGCDYIEPDEEIVPGVALSTARIHSEDFQLVTKPGGYGELDVIVQILDFLIIDK